MFNKRISNVQDDNIPSDNTQKNHITQALYTRENRMFFTALDDQKFVRQTYLWSLDEGRTEVKNLLSLI